MNCLIIGSGYCLLSVLLQIIPLTNIDLFNGSIMNKNIQCKSFLIAEPFKWDNFHIYVWEHHTWYIMPVPSVAAGYIWLHRQRWNILII